MTFNIWYRLSEYLYERNDDELNAQFKPYIERLDILWFLLPEHRWVCVKIYYRPMLFLRSRKIMSTVSESRQIQMLLSSFMSIFYPTYYFFGKVVSPYVWLRYIMALYKHCRFDTDQEDIPDENDDFVEFRGQVSDTLKDVVFIVGTDRCIQSVCFSILLWTPIDSISTLQFPLL